jgi:hypothetical protein
MGDAGRSAVVDEDAGLQRLERHHGFVAGRDAIVVAKRPAMTRCVTLPAIGATPIGAGLALLLISISNSFFARLGKPYQRAQGRSLI